MSILEVFGDNVILVGASARVPFTSPAGGVQNAAGIWDSSQPTRITLTAPGNYWFGTEIYFTPLISKTSIRAGIVAGGSWGSVWLCSDYWYIDQACGQEMWLVVSSPVEARAAGDYVEVVFFVPAGGQTVAVKVWYDQYSSGVLYPHFHSHRV